MAGRREWLPGWFPRPFFSRSMPERPSIADLELIEPAAPDDLHTYYDLRWRILRKPWDQPRGSERDDLDAESYKLMFKTADGRAVAVGRLHFNSPEEAQVRYMAVDPDWNRSGLGSRILQ